MSTSAAAELFLLGSDAADSDARYLLNQGVSDFAIWDFPVTFQDKFFGNRMKKFHDPCIRPITSLRTCSHYMCRRIKSHPSGHVFVNL